MALRKSSAYTKRKARPYTRSSKKRAKSYIKTVPNSQIVKFKMGDIKGFDKGEYPITLNVTSKENVQPIPTNQTRQRILPRSQNLPTPYTTRKQNAYRRRSRPYANRNVPSLRKNNGQSSNSKTKPNPLHNRSKKLKGRNRSTKINQSHKIPNPLQNLNQNNHF